jgi:hypothetical protein
MLENVFWASGFVLVCILIYRFALPLLKRFDAENVARIERQEREKSDPNAHIRHALETAEEQVEPVTEVKVGDGVQYLFEAQIYFDREDAEEARARRIAAIAQRFYVELPHALAGRESRSPLSARERAAQRWRRR